jgi:hypothetical protein
MASPRRFGTPSPFQIRAAVERLGDDAAATRLHDAFGLEPWTAEQATAAIPDTGAANLETWAMRSVGRRFAHGGRLAFAALSPLSFKFE